MPSQALAPSMRCLIGAGSRASPAAEFHAQTVVPMLMAPPKSRAVAAEPRCGACGHLHVWHLEAFKLEEIEGRLNGAHVHRLAVWGRASPAGATKNSCTARSTTRSPIHSSASSVSSDVSGRGAETGKLTSTLSPGAKAGTATGGPNGRAGTLKRPVGPPRPWQRRAGP